MARSDFQGGAGITRNSEIAMEKSSVCHQQHSLILYTIHGRVKDVGFNCSEYCNFVLSVSNGAWFQTCFEWFTKGILDLEPDTQSQLFQKELLKLDPAKITTKGQFEQIYYLIKYFSYTRLHLQYQIEYLNFFADAECRQIFIINHECRQIFINNLINRETS